MADVPEQKSDAALQEQADKALGELREGLAKSQKTNDPTSLSFNNPNSAFSPFWLAALKGPTVAFTTTPAGITPDTFSNPFRSGPVNPNYVDPNASIFASAATNFLDRNAHTRSQGLCAKYVRLACAEAGINFYNNPRSAKGYIPYLDNRNDFNRVEGWSQASAQKGDIVVFRAVPGHPHGHIQICMGRDEKGQPIWCSDFKQKGFLVSSAYQGGSYAVYRHNGQTAQAPLPAGPSGPNRSRLAADARRAPAYQAPQTTAPAAAKPAAAPGATRVAARSGPPQGQQPKAHPRPSPLPSV
ncbi:MAG: hypothetical protein WAO98_06920 [Alphaproteobacteria bacterium]